MSTRVALNEFFAKVQPRAFCQAEMAVGNRDDAKDIVQDAMIRLAQKYSEKEQEWPLLFHRILQNLIRDWFRKKKVRSIIGWWDQQDEPEESDQYHSSSPSPEKNKANEQEMERINAALQQLPYRQQQAFLLRSWWGHSVIETAYIMKCTEGSVKTHYSRATQRLKSTLGEVAL